MLSKIWSRRLPLCFQHGCTQNNSDKRCAFRLSIAVCTSLQRPSNTRDMAANEPNWMRRLRMFQKTGIRFFILTSTAVDVGHNDSRVHRVHSNAMGGEVECGAFDHHIYSSFGHAIAQAVCKTLLTGDTGHLQTIGKSPALSCRG